MHFLIDTDICSYFLRGQYGLDARFQAVGPDDLVVSNVTIAELEDWVPKAP